MILDIKDQLNKIHDIRSGKIKEGVEKAEAEEVKSKLEAAGAEGDLA